VLLSSDGTSGSHTALPGFESPAALHAGPGAPGVPGTPTRQGRWRGPPGLRGSPRIERTGRVTPTTRRRTPLAWTGLVAAAVALVAAGIGTGLLLRGPGAHATGNPNGPGTGPPCTSAPPGSLAQLCVSQPFGDGNTTFVIYGSGYRPGSLITVKVTGPKFSKVSTYEPIADQEGTFNYAIDQAHLLFPHSIPPGTYHVVVSAPGSSTIPIKFIVYSRNSAPPPYTRPAPPNPPQTAGPGGPGGQGGGGA
jgi:hypothetical protein